MCVCCQELVYQPVTTECLHNVCKVRINCLALGCFLGSETPVTKGIGILEK